MTAILLPLLVLAADTGSAAAARYPHRVVSAIYSEFDIKPRYSSQTTPTVVGSNEDRWLGEDKFRHFAFSYMITAGTFGVASLISDRDASITIGAAVGAAAGVLKEIYDKKTGQSSSARDLIWDAAGVAAGVLIARETR